MIGKIRTVAAMVVLSFGAATAASANNILTNGNFEGSTYTGPSGPAGADLLPSGWVLGPPGTPNSTDVNVQSAVNLGIDEGPESGAYYVGFASQALSGKDCLYQDFVTTAGQQYNLSFWVAFTASNAGNTGQSGLDVVWDESGGNYQNLDYVNGGVFYSFPTNTGPVAYQQFNYTVTASSNITRLDFHGVETSGEILLDNVSVSTISSTPEPASLLLAGFGLLIVGAVPRLRRLNGRR